MKMVMMPDDRDAARDVVDMPATDAHSAQPRPDRLALLVDGDEADGAGAERLTGEAPPEDEDTQHVAEANQLHDRPTTAVEVVVADRGAGEAPPLQMLVRRPT